MPNEKELQQRLFIESEKYSLTKDKLDQLKSASSNLEGKQKKEVKSSIRQMESFLKRQKRIITSLNDKIDKQIGKG